MICQIVFDIIMIIIIYDAVYDGDGDDQYYYDCLG